jgi:hypothetical protein
MEKTVKKDLITILTQTKSILQKGNYSELKEVSDHTIHDASVFQDEDSVSIAVVVYSLFKIMQRLMDKGLAADMVHYIDECLELIDLDDMEGYRNCIKNVLHTISKADSRLKVFIEEVINQSEIKKGSKLYEHGISMARAAEILGITQWELMNYIGKTRIPELEAEKFDVENRLNFARKIFNLR